MMRLTGVSGPVLVTGAGGFVGANLALRLVEADADVHLIVRPGSDQGRLRAIQSRCQLHETDIVDASGVRRLMSTISPAVVFHAAKFGGHPSRMNHAAAYRTNVIGTRAVLEALPPGACLVALGSSLEYGPGDRPLVETDTPRPDTVHGLTKAAATDLCMNAARTRGAAVTVLRLFSVYGPMEPAARFIPTVIHAAQHDETVSLTRPGVMHDWVYVDDVVEACFLAAASAAVHGEVVNIGTGFQTSNEDVVATVESITGRPVRRSDKEFPAAPYDRAVWVADVQKARRLLGWTARTPLADGLARTEQWMRDA